MHSKHSPDARISARLMISKRASDVMEPLPAMRSTVQSIRVEDVVRLLREDSRVKWLAVNGSVVSLRLSGVPHTIQTAITDDLGKLSLSYSQQWKRYPWSEVK